MKIKSVANLTYHRNGVQGEGFYSAFIKVYGDKDTFLLTFTTVEDNFSSDQVPYIPSCRVICTDKPTENWRGDEYGISLHHWLKQQYLDKKATCIYDLTTNEARTKQCQLTNQLI